jgi:hypothetical protein
MVLQWNFSLPITYEFSGINPMSFENEGNVTARLTYLAASVESSLYRNGKVFTHRDHNGNDDAYHGAVTEQRDVLIRDARRLEPSHRRQLGVHGLELLHRPLARPDLHFFDNRQVVREYYPECAEIVRRATNAGHVLAFDHNIRRTQGKESDRPIADGQQVQKPIYVAHGDYTLVSAPQRLRDLARAPGMNDTFRSVLREGEPLLSAEVVSRTLNEHRRFALINVWRNIDRSPVVADPLALCDGQRVAPEDLVVFEIHYHDRIGENYFAKYSPNHEWWYYPLMTRDEVILIKQWDSAGGLAQSGAVGVTYNSSDSGVPCTFSLHSAFKDPNTPAEAPHRQSIEVRCVAFFD